MVLAPNVQTVDPAKKPYPFDDALEAFLCDTAHYPRFALDQLSIIVAQICHILQGPYSTTH